MHEPATVTRFKCIWEIEYARPRLRPCARIGTRSVFMPDLVHLSPKGYEAWAASIEPKLRQLMGEK